MVRPRGRLRRGSRRPGHRLRAACARRRSQHRARSTAPSSSSRSTRCAPIACRPTATARSTTPAIDRLAADGVLFERAYSHAPQTLPAHASILTGRLPYQHGVRDNVGFVLPPGEADSRRHAEARRLPDGGVRLGVRAAAANRDRAGVRPLRRLVPARNRGVHGQPPAGRHRHGRRRRCLAGRPARRPLLPVRPPLRAAPAVARAAGRFCSHARAYDGDVAYADAVVGRLLDAAASARLRTTARSSSCSPITARAWATTARRSTGCSSTRGDSRAADRQAARVRAGAGSRVATPVQHIDLVPTLLDLAGLPAPHGLDGALAARLARRQRATLPDRSIYSETFYPRYHFGWSELYSLTDDAVATSRRPRRNSTTCGTIPGNAATWRHHGPAPPRPWTTRCARPGARQSRHRRPSAPRSASGCRHWGTWARAARPP